MWILLYLTFSYILHLGDLPPGCIKLEHVVTKIDYSDESVIRVTCKIKGQEEKVILKENKLIFFS